MEIERYIVIHEVGHLVAGIHLGVEEQGICFNTGRADELAQTWYNQRSANSEQRLIRSLAGLLSHLIVCPETLSPIFRDVLNHSIIPSKNHPLLNLISDEDREYWGGARSDIDQALHCAEEICQNQLQEVEGTLRRYELETRSIIDCRRSEIIAVADDVSEWLSEPEREDDLMLLYPAPRAAAITKMRVAYVTKR
jgi:hypothetical protein